MDQVAIWGLTLAVGVLSFTGPAYMLLLYSHALPGGDPILLLQLTAAMLALYAVTGCIDAVRQLVLLRRARAIDDRVMAMPATQLPPLHELDRLHIFLSGPAPAAMCDLPFLPLYLAALCWLHPWLGAFGTVAAMVIALCWLAGNRKHASGAANALELMQQRATLAAQLADTSPRTAQSRMAASRALKIVHHRLRIHQDTQPGPWWRVTLRSLRPALQSTMLGLAVWLAATGACHPMAVLVAAMLLPRIVGPLETTLAQRDALGAVRAIAKHIEATCGQPPSGVTKPIVIPMNSKMASSAEGKIAVRSSRGDASAQAEIRR
ncbi:hypothetical protein [Hyphomicrobium sp. D-2]|uniref:hypothetical protein n=1 Tax=Hyphomicrobium sp. D-2 TaxID=3041621 RepID=UPI002453B87E|nr:hypothetical protein [Hyphomicrobium sp. D-2]MDH4983206.1 hypothetical protein [Hyphomicrobium sp. D-2]